MKRLLGAALAAATFIAPLSIASTASAQHYRGDDRGRHDNNWNRGRDHDRRDYDRRDRRDRRDYDRRDHRRDRWDHRRHNGYYYNNRWYYGPPPGAWRNHARYDYRQWRRGDRLPSYYRSHYRAVDYRHHRLRSPPRGYHYVRDDRGDYLLVGIATGVILGIIASH